MRVKETLKRLAASVAVVAALTGVVVAVTAAPAQAATCRTVELEGDWYAFAIHPYMSVPICYNGSQVWVNGGITPGVQGWGVGFGGFDWSGSYNDGSRSWLGVGENFSASSYNGVYSTYCAPRWYINARGAVYSYSRNCR